MSDYKAKNSSNSTKFLFSERAKYHSAPELQGNSTLADYIFFENIFYHRIDQNYNTIVPNESFIVDYHATNAQTIPFRGMPFACLAMSEFMDDYNQQIDQDPATDKENPYLSSIKVYNSFTSPIVAYQNYLNFFLLEYERYIKQNNPNIIQDFEDFVNHFFIFFKNYSPQKPLTLSAWQKSKYSSIFTTGMAFSISNLDCGNDEDKEKFFIDSINWPIYVQLAANYGFNIIKNCPWILIANCNSSIMKEYTVINYDYYNTETDETGILTQTQNRTFNTNNEMYNSLYNKTYIEDINYIINNIINIYNKFNNNIPYYSKLYYTSQGTRKVNFNRSMDLTLSDLYKLFLYIDIRNIEENNAYSEAIINRIKDNTKYLIKKLDFSDTLSYINDQFRAAHLKTPGGLNEFLFLDNTSED